MRFDIEYASPTLIIGLIVRKKELIGYTDDIQHLSRYEARLHRFLIAADEDFIRYRNYFPFLY